ncbi:MAG: phosphoesterase [Proteobacteria bacterium]|nr:phosphoesterase [Pseudomonadota bacterium]MBU1386369.1 phosphoesterase [Pseudomonadota bacterium]MBU1544480.1 phosphoesterase [Pseudomonadota bacterium]MBU2429511.1 phosphoesterase [Pseudomonadota bacterium]MBU2480341.1 phosphoesterase [Pseudomonadota bacterium]
MARIEQVLCIIKKDLPEAWIKQKTIIKLDIDEFICACTRAGFRFIDRPEAENNPSLKQIIPYIVLQTRDLKMTAVYSRKGSEKRLHDLKSIGIGGHINPVDSNLQGDDFEQILLSGMQRELAEELEQRPLNDQPDFVGILNEDMTDVGKVHFGAVFRILTDCPDAFVPGEELSDFKWVATDSLKNENLELWSELALTLIQNS